MTTKICIICGLEINDNSTKCPRCGYSDRTFKKMIIKSFREHPLIYIGILLIIVITCVNVTSNLIKKWERVKETEKQYQAMQVAVENKNWLSARTSLAYFSNNNLTDYEDVRVLERKIKIENFKETLQSLPASKVLERLNILDSLVSLDPLNMDFINRRDAARLDLEREQGENHIKEGVRESVRQSEIKKKIENSGWYVTKYGYIAAISEAYLERAISFAAQGDRETFDKYVVQNYPYIFILKGGNEVYLEEVKPWKGYAKIRSKGSTTSLWTQYKALDPK